MLPQEQSNIPPAAPAPQAPVAPKSQRGHAFLITLTILMLFAGGYATWYFLNPPPEYEDYSVAKSDPTAHWKTYRNEEYGFEFKYPEQYRAYEDEPGIIQIIRLEDKTSENYGPVNQMVINVFNNQNNLGIINWWNKYGGYKRNDLDPNDFPIRNINIGDINAIIVDGSKGVLSNYMVTAYKGKIIEIMHMIPETDQILSTFKFISTSTSAQ